MGNSDTKDITSVSIDKDVLEESKKRAHEKYQSFSSFVENLLKLELENGKVFIKEKKK